MTHRKARLIGIAFISSLIALGSATSSASASGDYSRHGQNSSHRHRHSSDYAGKITIDGYTTVIRTNRPMLRQIAHAFRDAGYRAWVSDGRVEVDFGYCRPSVYWKQGRYRAHFNWYDDDLSISLRRIRQYGYRESSHQRHHPIRVARRSIGWAYSD